MRLLSTIITVVLVLTLIGGVAIGAYLIYSNVSPPAPQPPAIELSSVEAGDIVTVAAAARGEHVARAELWAGDQLIAREINPNPALSSSWAVAWQWQPPAPGVYSLVARAFDDAGRYGASQAFNLVIPPKQTLLFSSNRDGSYALYQINTATRATGLWQPSASQDRQPSASPAKIVAFTATKDNKQHIVSRPLDKAVLTDLTPDLDAAQRPAWSADGKQLAFEVTSAGATNLFIGDADGKNRKQITTTDAYDGQASFNPSSDHVAFTAQQAGQWDIYTVAVDGSQLTRLTADPAQEAQPAWSPDGNRIAFVSNRSGIAQIYTMNADGDPKSIVQLTNIPSGAEQPKWSPDGTWLAFVANTGAAQDASTPVPNNRREIYVMYAPPTLTNPDMSGLIRLTQNTSDDTDITWVLP